MRPGGCRDPAYSAFQLLICHNQNGAAAASAAARDKALCQGGFGTRVYVRQSDGAPKSATMLPATSGLLALWVVEIPPACACVNSVSLLEGAFVQIYARQEIRP
jgi:hypothetical protein